MYVVHQVEGYQQQLWYLYTHLYQLFKWSDVSECILGLARASTRYNDMYATHITRVPLNIITSMHMSIIMAPLVKLDMVISVGMRVDVECRLLLALDGTES